MAVEINGYNLSLPPVGEPQAVGVLTRRFAPNARLVSRVCTSGAGDGFEGITTSSSLGHGLSLIVENAQSRDFITWQMVANPEVIQNPKACTIKLFHSRGFTPFKT